MATTSETVMTELQTPARKAVNLRSVLLGLLGVVFICTLTPYNDWVVANTYAVGNFLPIGLLLFFLVVILLVNGPLSRFAPKWAFSRGELGVALCMMLVSCALPSSGLMRYLPAHLVSPWYIADTNTDYAQVMKEAGLPDWVFPTFEKPMEARGTDPVVRYFWDRVPVEDPTFYNRFMAVPWKAWFRPTVTWGILFGLIASAMICLSVVFRRQWVDNERLPYPLATVYLSVIEEPAPGRMFNSLFSAKWFWFAAIGVFIIHGANALNSYLPRIVPEIPIRYAFGNILGDPPFAYTDWGFKSARLFFSMIGITYFLQSNVALSLWLCYVVMQVMKMFMGTYQADFSYGMQMDQNFGAAVVFAASILFVARQQLLLIAKHMLGRASPDDAQGRYLPYSVAGWGLLLSVAGIVVWFVSIGTTIIGAMVIVAMAGLLYLVIARVVAETGLMFVQLTAAVYRPFVLFAQSMPEGMAIKTTATTFYAAGMTHGIFVHDQRESLSGFMPHALRVADGAAYEGDRSWHRGIFLTGALVLALVVGFFVSGASMLYVEYSFGATADARQSSPINSYGTEGAIYNHTLSVTRDYIAKGGPTENHNRWKHIAIGGIVTGTLSFLRLRFAGWPIHPVGYLLMYTYPMHNIWFSIMLGWLVKVVVVKFGGSSMYRTIKPLFLGLIIGEVSAAAFWLVVSLVLNAAGMDYRAINLLPT